MNIDDGLIEYALYDLLRTLDLRAGESLRLEVMRSLWRSTALPHTDLYTAIGLLLDADSLDATPKQDMPGWTLTETGYARAWLAGAPTTMGDEVARSVLKQLRQRVPAMARAPRPVAIRRHSYARAKARRSAAMRAA